jgi:hypothetical protein
MHLGRCNKILATRQHPFAAIISSRRLTFPSLAAVGRFLREFATGAEAVKGLEQQKNRYYTDRDVNATTHSL